jgi:hypothetical protein
MGEKKQKFKYRYNEELWRQRSWICILLLTLLAGYSMIINLISHHTLPLIIVRVSPISKNTLSFPTQKQNKNKNIENIMNLIWLIREFTQAC